MTELATRYREGVAGRDRPPRRALVRRAARRARRVPLLPRAARQRRPGRGHDRRRARRLPAPLHAQPRHRHDAVPQHGADVPRHDGRPTSTGTARSSTRRSPSSFALDSTYPRGGAVFAPHVPMQRACGTALGCALALALALVAAVGVVPAQAELQLGIQDDALLTSQEPNAWPFARGLGPKVIRYNIGWEQVAPTQPDGARRSGRSGLRLQARRRDGPADGRDRRAEPVHDRQRAEVGERQPRAALRAGQRRRLRPVLRRRRLALLGHLHAAGRARAAARRQELHGLERAQPRPVPAAAGPRRSDRRAHVRGPRARLRRCRARRLARRPGRRRADREPRRAGRRLADRVPRRAIARPAARARRRSRSTRT